MLQVGSEEEEKGGATENETRRATHCEHMRLSRPKSRSSHCYVSGVSTNAKLAREYRKTDTV